MRDLAAMRLLDEAHLQFPFYGSRRLSDRLGAAGICYSPEIFNTDQGAQFTSAAFTDVLKGAAVAPGRHDSRLWVLLISDV